MSHQRVQQIVQAAGGSWWTRVWRNRNAKPDMTCTFCGSPRSSRTRCSFCGERPTEGQLVGAHGAWMCPIRLGQVRHIMDTALRSNS